MSKIRRRRVIFSLLMMQALLTGGAFPDDSDRQPAVYPENALTQHLNRETLREIFFMRRRSWPDGTPIRVFVLPDSDPLHASFAKEVLDVYPYQLRSAWDRLVFSGTGRTPTVVENFDEMRRRVDSTPGSIGYVWK